MKYSSLTDKAWLYGVSGVHFCTRWMSFEIIVAIRRINLSDVFKLILLTCRKATENAVLLMDKIKTLGKKDRISRVNGSFLFWLIFAVHGSLIKVLKNATWFICLKWLFYIYPLPYCTLAFIPDLCVGLLNLQYDFDSVFWLTWWQSNISSCDWLNFG